MGDKTVKYAGKQVEVSWDGKLCIHVGECGRAEGELFVGGREPWCQPELVERAEVTDVIARCPTGALSCHTKDGTQLESASAENTIHVSHNGPLYVRGDLAIKNAPEDAPGLAFRAALCRCGESTNKPYCDNSHEKAAFSDSGAVGQRGKPLDSQGGKLNVTPAPNGPLLVKGNVTIAAATGRVAWEGTQVALCRCGASKNKPFCDGSHKASGFVSD